MKMVLANREEEERERWGNAALGGRAGGLPKHAAGEDERETEL